MLSLLHEIKAWARANAPAALESLNDPATARELRKLKFVLPSNTPIGLFELLSVHNGESYRLTNTLLPDGMRLLPVDDILQTYLRALKEPGPSPEEGWALVKSGIYFSSGPVVPISRHALRVPFADSESGTSWFIDLFPAQGGAMGQIISEDIEDCSWRVVAVSLESLLQSYLDGLRAEIFVLGCDGCLRDDNDLWRPK